MKFSISIHALRKEGDQHSGPWLTLHTAFLSTPSARRATKAAQHVTTFRCISIHALRKEGDVSFEGTDEVAVIFLSTPSARRATRSPIRAMARLKYFYPRPPQGGRQWSNQPELNHGCISIHALRKEGDWNNGSNAGVFNLFLSTPSARRAT